MSVSGISFLSGAGLSSDGGQTASAMADTPSAFASVMAGASKPAATPASSRRDDGDDQGNAGKAEKSTKAKSKDDRDDDDSTPIKADGDQAASAAAAQSTAANAATKDASDGKTAKAKGQESVATVADDGTQASAADAATDPTTAQLIDPSFAAPVLAALKAAAAAGQEGKAVLMDAPAVAPDPAPATAPSAAQQADTAAPLTGTAALMAARAAANPVAVQASETRTTAASTRKRDGADKTASIDSLAAAISTQAGDMTQADGAKGDASTTGTPDASQQLADGAADRQLDLAKQGAWLDGLARDIASTGSASSTLRFQVAPQNLGTVQVELARGVDGAAVTLTASSESARAILADARPQLVAEARAQGIHIANAQVDVGSDSRSSGGGSQHEQRHDSRGDGGFSSQAGAGGGDNGRDNGRSQTRSQPIAINQSSDGRADAGTSGADVASAAEPADGIYA
ncbi:flagellar hook-length control protein FliK [Sphingomonas abietis]|uniref:Flagellar hook-length control protein FliK n=1 Tax=Sphingomonas abietis TaxID=3012344 RepID=A0ABY7NKU3_9SPHN|nr:flagellar hook-length control protein FliK [Sphingomonas abietis]WBO22114.1 flagellar hook-length control protein FliK [Sphingomonas abietis]